MANDLSAEDAKFITALPDSIISALEPTLRLVHGSPCRASFRRRVNKLAVDLFSMSDTDYQNQELVVDRLVDDPIAADSEPSQTTELTLEGTPSGRFRGKPIDSLDEALTVDRISPSQRLGCATLDLNRVGQA